LHHHRHEPDLNVLKDHPEVNLIAPPFQYQAFINSFSVNRTAKEGANRIFDEGGFDTSSISYLCQFLPAFVHKNRFNCILSCAFNYDFDQSWQVASHKTNVPFIVLQKEMLDNKIEIEYKPDETNYHYEIMPYTFALKLAKRLVSKSYFDLGQGILKCIQSIYKEHNTLPTYDGMIIKE